MSESTPVFMHFMINKCKNLSTFKKVKSYDLMVKDVRHADGIYCMSKDVYRCQSDGELKLFIGDGMLIHATKVAGIK